MEDKKFVQKEFDWEPAVPKRLELLTPDEMFDQMDHELLVALKEDKRLERKPANYHGPALADYLSMWANTPPDGGLMVLGVNDDGTFHGCAKMTTGNLNRLEAMQDVCPDAQCASKRVPVTLPNGDQDFVVVARVYYRRGRAVRTPQGKVCARRGDRRKYLTPEEARELAIDKGEIDFEQESCKSLAWPDDFDREAIKVFCESVVQNLELSPNIPSEEILNVRHLGSRKDGAFVPNMACALLFAKEPDRLIPGCKIRFLRFDGEQEGTGEKFNAVKDIWIEGKTVPELIHEAESVITAQVRTFSALGKNGKFYAVPEYPKAAWYEAIVNACAHRSYSNGLKNKVVTVKMFDNRLEIESPGPFLPFVNPKNIYGDSHPRNPKLMRAMYFMRFVKMGAEGTRRMRDTMVELELPEPQFEQAEINHSRVRVTLWNNIRQRREWVDSDVAAIVGAALARTLTDRDTRIVNFIAEHGKINVTDTMRITNAAWDTAKRHLDKLVERQILEHVHRDDIERDSKAYYKLKVGS